MAIMLLKMILATSLYVLVTLALWHRLRGSMDRVSTRVGVGLVFGACSILSTHFGIDFGHMLLNVRDIGPLAAGFLFHPVSGVIAGLIGGVERFIAGEYWGIGSYTRLACSLSTCLAGLLTLGNGLRVMHYRRPTPVQAFFLGTVMEVFHMYVVLITHRSDMSMAYYVVKTCSGPMMLFTALGFTGCVIGIEVMEGEWRNPFKRRPDSDLSLDQYFQKYALIASGVVFLINIAFSYALQSGGAIQTATETLMATASDIRETYGRIRATEDGLEELLEESALTVANAIVQTVQDLGGVEAVDADYIEELRDIYGLVGIAVVSPEGEALYQAGNAPLATGMFNEVLEGEAESRTARLSNKCVGAVTRCGSNLIQITMDPEPLNSSLGIGGLNDALSFFHVGSEGCFDLVRRSGIIVAGDHRNMSLTKADLETVQAHPLETTFIARMFNRESLVWTEPINDDLTLLILLPTSEVYANRDAQVYESIFADILWFAVIYSLISYLIRKLVVTNLEQVNASLAKITAGNLNEVVDVRSSSEFATLSDDINLTVNALKGYIDDAKKRIEQELDFARAIQDAALPKNFTFKRTDFQLYALMDPAREVGGDFYDFFFVRQNLLALVIADVSGKGIPASLFMMRSKATIRSLAVSGKSPDEILYEANLTLCEGNDAEMFVTAWVGIIDLTTGVMQCASAGHEFPVLMRAGGDYALFRDKHGLPLAAMEGVPYRAYTIEFKPGDRLFVYTDGVPEAINEDEVQYGVDRLIHRLNASKAMTMADALPSVRRDIDDFAGNMEQFDDITMLGFIYNGNVGGRNEHEGIEP